VFASIDAPALVPLPAHRYEVPRRLSEIPPPGAAKEPKPVVPVAEGSPGLSEYVARLLRRQYRAIVDRDAGHVTDQWRKSGRSAAPPPLSGSTEEELRQSRERLALILNSIDDGFVAVDSNGRVTYLNTAARSMLAEQGIAADGLLGKHYVEEAFPGLRNTEGGRGFYRAMGEREPVTVLNFYAPFARWYAIRFFPTADGGITIVFQDVTERKREEDAIKESESRFRALAEASTGLVWQVDQQGNAVYLNPRFREMLDRPLKQLMGTGWHSVVHPDDLAGYVAALQEAIQQRAPLRSRVRAKMKEGDWRWLESSAMPCFSADGDYVGHVGSSIVVTDNIDIEAIEAAGKATNRGGAKG
jgi:PAS domain S-box-containing protein